MNVLPVRSIQAGTSMNVIEIDAASNNGVDNIREIREEVAYPSDGRAGIRCISSMRCICFLQVLLMHC